ncbi:MAG: tetratricopeptide repeat protein [Alphaproteobacteria bacterium]
MKKPETIEAYFEGTDIHDERRVGSCGVAAIFASALFMVLHGYNAWLFFFAGSIGFTKALIFHFTLALAAGLLAKAFSAIDREGRFFLLLFVSTLAMGVFGAAGTLLSALLHIWYMRYAQPFTVWFNSIFPSPVTNESQQIYDDIQVGRDESSKPYSVVPFLDVIWYGNEAQKRMALSKMTSRFHPTFAPAFKKALGDSSNSIRIQAATAISKIENQFMHRMMKLNQLHNEQPKNPVITLALAEHFDDYAFTGILDDDRERENRAQALKHYQEYLNLRPTDTETHVKIGRLLMRSNDPLRAIDWLRQSIERGHKSQALMGWYAEALFACGRFSELRQLAHEGRWKVDSDKMSPVLAETMAFWANTPAMPETKGKRGRV